MFKYKLKLILKKPSGAENIKRKLRLNKNVQKLPKIVNFFKKKKLVVRICINY